MYDAIRQQMLLITFLVTGSVANSSLGGQGIAILGKYQHQQYLLLLTVRCGESTPSNVE